MEVLLWSLGHTCVPQRNTRESNVLIGCSLTDATTAKRSNTPNELHNQQLNHLLSVTYASCHLVHFQVHTDISHREHT
jgi:hypothetical protein